LIHPGKSPVFSEMGKIDENSLYLYEIMSPLEYKKYIRKIIN